MSGDAESSAPRLDPSTHSHYIDLSVDRLHVEYIGMTRNERDVGCARADEAVSWDSELFYFEATVLQRASNGVSMSIGLTPRVFDPNRHPGWDAGSYAYHAATGRKLGGDDVKGTAYAKHWGAVGDVVGCGVHTDTREVFFTLNGMHLGTAFRGVRGPLFATVGLHRRGERMELNFGGAPFAFDVEPMLLRYHHERMQQLAKYHVDPLAVRALVVEYLRADGFTQTLRAMGVETGPAPDPMHSADEDSDDVPTPVDAHEDGAHHSGMTPLARSEMYERGRARALAMDGAWDALLDWLDENASHPCSHLQRAVAMVQCQKFVELVAAGAIERALAYAQGTLAGAPRAQQPRVHRVLALLAYPNLADAPDRALLQRTARRAEVADAVTRCMLAHQRAITPLPRLERVFTHYQLLRRLLREQRMPGRVRRGAQSDEDEDFDDEDEEEEGDDDLDDDEIIVL